MSELTQSRADSKQFRAHTCDCKFGYGKATQAKAKSVRDLHRIEGPQLSVEPHVGSDCALVQSDDGTNTRSGHATFWALAIERICVPRQ
jgi:hypothetical protein